MISAAGVVALASGVIGAGAILLAPAEAIHAAPKPTIDFTYRGEPAQAPATAG